MVAALKEQQTHFDEVLRRAGIALQGRDVGVWEVRANGRVSPVAVSSSHRSPTETTVELDNVLASWGERGTGSRWLGLRLEQGGQWCVAPVRADAPEPPPAGIERRSPERMTLELAGLCIGLMDDTTGRVSGHALRQANSLLRESQARLDLLARTTPAILWTTDAALRITSTSGAGLEEVGLTPDQLVGISLLDGPNALSCGTPVRRHTPGPACCSIGAVGCGSLPSAHLSLGGEGRGRPTLQLTRAGAGAPSGPLSQSCALEALGMPHWWPFHPSNPSILNAQNPVR